MGIARSTYYGAPAADRDAEIITRIEAICAEFEAYGYRRVTAELRHQGLFVNSKRVRRLMREHGLSPKQRRRYVRSEEHTSELQSRLHLVCRLLLEKKKKK